MPSMPKTDIKKAQQLYQKIYKRAFPHAGMIPLNKIEIASFNRCHNLSEFRKTGLGLEVDVIYNSEYKKGHTNIGHTGKVIMSLPGQFMVEHQHADIEILSKKSKIPKGYVDINKNINAFVGIYAYNADGSVKRKNKKPIFRFKAKDHTIVQSKSKRSQMVKKIIHHFEGKSETFHIMFGEGMLMSDDAVILYAPRGTNPDKIPKDLKKRVIDRDISEIITTKRMLYLTPGTIVLLPKHCKHSFLAGKNGAVFLEFSTSSLDEADIFSDERVIR